MYRKQGPINMNDDSSKIGKLINGFNDYLAKINKEIDLDEHSLAIHYDYDIALLPNDLVDMANEKNKREK